ncbi:MULTISPECIES: hypothetical protein [Nocardia]|uniref:Uncharacterized protein n=2 Tax=Nocardia TaxID=1817 RepID=K0F3B3_NOCB7|nr:MULTISPECIES: hypothetical protein [Nocardia]AFU03620.1 hypothetical protein O3I_028355 [Nocardia brasiliensis ATCC 700358]ASF06445.1 hypothetical protein CEQ30_02830 [Nocardia brasiliensis]KIA60480.1 hypothetical protein FG87_36900 [Nocardia vulneris]MBF6126275.1 hypothetical protein [Nocardia brasiliensis]MBF6542717.1 hypothetical protein [Nocardia brasiliensis]
MARFLIWFRNNVDGSFAVLLAITVGLLQFLDVIGTDQVNAAMLLVLGLVAITLLRDRHLSAKAVRDATSVHLLYGPEIGHAHTLARRGTEQWMFKGGTGTYIRAVTLRECVENARREQRPLRVQLEILDPTDEQLCKTYAQFRSSLQPEADRTGELWTTERTRKEAYATVLAGCWYRQRFTFLTIDIGLSAVMTTFRWDLSSSCVIVTQDNPNTPAMMFERDKPYYRDFNRELVASFKQTKQVPLSRTEELPLSDEPTVDQVRGVFQTLGLELPAAFTDRDVADIVRRALQPRNPY